MSVFRFKYFEIEQDGAPQKVGTDAMVLGALVDTYEPKQILDVGTGNGVLALICAQKFTQAIVTGLDIFEEATSVADFNFKQSPFASRMHVVHQNFLDYQVSEKFDLIISNPPYFNTQMPSENNLRSLARHEDSMSVIDLIIHSLELLSENGELWMIVPSNRYEELTQQQKLVNIKKVIQIFGKPGNHVRDILVFAKNVEKQISISDFTIRDVQGNYTAAYNELTKELHFR
ncbi:MAG: methyltransferase [Brumimicrobium sp.]|nr:methyltransferase [Brumimicrobium sp.]